jgi:hypothetical protein
MSFSARSRRRSRTRSSAAGQAADLTAATGLELEATRPAGESETDRALPGLRRLADAEAGASARARADADSGQPLAPVRRARLPRAPRRRDRPQARERRPDPSVPLGLVPGLARRARCPCPRAARRSGGRARATPRPAEGRPPRSAAASSCLLYSCRSASLSHPGGTATRSRYGALNPLYGEAFSPGLAVRLMCDNQRLSRPRAAA